MTTYYGVYDHSNHPIAARIWGHRLRAGQHWTLEGARRALRGRGKEEEPQSAADSEALLEEIRAAVADLEDGCADVAILQHLRLRLAQDGFRQGRRPGAEVVGARHDGVPRSVAAVCRSAADLAQRLPA